MSLRVKGKKGVKMKGIDLKEIEKKERAKYAKYGCSCDIVSEIQKFGRPLHMGAVPSNPISQHSQDISFCRIGDAESAYRMLNNNLNPEVAIDWQKLIVYGGAGRACRNWHEYYRTVNALKKMKEDQTLLISSGRILGLVDTHPGAPRVLIANSNIVPHWATQENFDLYDKMGLTMYGQMTAGSWIYIATQGILQGTYLTFLELAKKEFNRKTLRGKFVLSAGLGGMSAAQPLAVTMNGGVVLVVEARAEKAIEKVQKGLCMSITNSLDQALFRIEEESSTSRPFSIALVGNAADVYPELVRRGVIPDIVTDQTPAHDIWSYIPVGNLEYVDKLRSRDPAAYKRVAYKSFYKHVSAMLKMQEAGAVVFDYGNNLRQQAEIAGLKIRDDNGKFLYPGFVPAYIRPLFCEGKGPFRWVALSGDPKDIFTLDKALIELFPKDKDLKKWIKLAQKNIPFQGLPARICWLGLEQRDTFGVLVNYLVAKGKVKAPIVFGRDHLDCGSVASPNRETEDMLDGSDAISDHVFLGAMLNAASGATWVSVHQGGGVGVPFAQHNGMVIVANGEKSREAQLSRVLRLESEMGVLRHADAGYKLAQKIAKEKGVKIPE